MAVARAAGGQAIREGVAEAESVAAFEADLLAYVWEPVYLPYERIS
jgi:hypothetical protein